MNKVSLHIYPPPPLLSSPILYSTNTHIHTHTNTTTSNPPASIPRSLLTLPFPTPQIQQPTRRKRRKREPLERRHRIRLSAAARGGDVSAAAGDAILAQVPLFICVCQSMNLDRQVDRDRYTPDRCKTAREAALPSRSRCIGRTRRSGSRARPSPAGSRSARPPSRETGTGVSALQRPPRRWSS